MDSLIPFISSLVVVVVLLLIAREITLWYFRIPEFIKNQQKTNELLEQIIANQEDIFSANQAPKTDVVQTQIDGVRSFPPQSP
jgi:predicted PurR-regulated permease PerM